MDPWNAIKMCVCMYVCMYECMYVSSIEIFLQSRCRRLSLRLYTVMLAYCELHLRFQQLFSMNLLGCTSKGLMSVSSERVGQKLPPSPIIFSPSLPTVVLLSTVFCGHECKAVQPEVVFMSLPSL
jgi:hypothetical protein